jgi:hypothetical protein
MNPVVPFAIEDAELVVELDSKKLFLPQGNLFLRFFCDRKCWFFYFLNELFLTCM